MRILDIQNLNFKYGKDYVLKNINLTLEQGDILGLVGENGAGKSTLMKLISGIIPNSESTNFPSLNGSKSTNQDLNNACACCSKLSFIRLFL